MFKSHHSKRERGWWYGGVGEGGGGGEIFNPKTHGSTSVGKNQPSSSGLNTVKLYIKK